MSTRHLLVGTAVVATLSALPAEPAGQGAQGVATPDAAAAGWTPPRTPDGQPDIQGIWINYDPTPFEVALPTDPRRVNDGTGPSADFDDTVPKRVPRRRSMVIDPPSGRVPVLPWAEAKRDDDLKRIQDSWEHQTPWDRCITRGGSPGGMFPGGYGNGYRIVQSPGVVSILYEMIHEPRIIPVDGRPHLPSNIRLWNGDPRGRWEGNTLVVDVTNYHDRGAIASNAASGRIRGIPHSDELHVVERFTIVDRDTINYRITISDPKVYTAPWTVEMPLKRDDSYRMFEYACHEGNYAMPNTLSAGRAEDKAAGRKK
jgi:hypothetical protein